MNYANFKIMIEKKQVITNEDYELIVKSLGEVQTAKLFEMYLSDKTVADDDEKMQRTSVYIDKMNDEMVEEIAEKTVTDDSIKMYLKEIGRVKLLSLEEEIAITNNVYNSLQKLNEMNVNQEKNDLILESLGYEGNKNDNTVRKIEKELQFISDQIKELAKNGYNVNELKELAEQLKVQYIYQTEKDKLVSSNLRLVVSIAKKYVGRGVPFLDLIQEGNEGLMKAADKFEPAKGFKFSTYATWWIRQSITRTIADQGRIIRIPVHLYDGLKSFNAICSLLENENGIEPTKEDILKYYRDAAIKELKNNGNNNPTEKEIKEAMNITPEKYEEYKKLNLGVGSLQTPIGEEQDSTLEDFVEDDRFNVEDIATESLFCDSLRNALTQYVKSDDKNSLTERELFVICLRNGINCSKTYTLEEIAQKFNITRERIRQIESKAYRKLRHKAEIRSMARDKGIRVDEKPANTYYAYNKR